MNQHQQPALTGQVTAGPGGAMTVEVGVITGDLTVTTTDAGDGTAAISVQYTGADEWYVLEGSPVAMPEDGLAAVQGAVIKAIRAGGAACAPSPGRA
ncbi:hypothetical protein [Streptomyces sp. NPDC001604]|uniref:hypothetical protein n=1 Tax=Streptomyces sp. NPDC001604 TaxID=3364593 RepID=UPI0036A8FD1A